MKISFFGIDFPQGKFKYRDESMEALIEKCKPAKVSPFFAEFIKEELVRADAIITARETLLDIVLSDIEKIESRLANASDAEETAALKSAVSFLEKETPLCDADLSEATARHLKTLSPASIKPVAVVTAANPAAPTQDETNAAVEAALKKAGIVFFYTAGPKEVHAWPVAKDSDIVICAGRIHSDLARGFIRADVVSYGDFLAAHNMNDARERGFVKVVGKDYKILEGDIIEIRSGV